MLLYQVEVRETIGDFGEKELDTGGEMGLHGSCGW